MARRRCDNRCEQARPTAWRQQRQQCARCSRLLQQQQRQRRTESAPRRVSNRQSRACASGSAASHDHSVLLAATVRIPLWRKVDAALWYQGVAALNLGAGSCPGFYGSWRDRRSGLEAATRADRPCTTAARVRCAWRGPRSARRWS